MAAAPARRLAAAALLATATLVGCSAQPLPDAHDEVIDVVTTTPLLADIARTIAGDHARVTSLIPPGADPHTYEPTLRSIRNVANADLGLSTNLFLEQHSLTETLDESLPQPDDHIRVAEASGAYDIHLIPLVEDISLDTVWLGLKVAGGDGLTSTDAVRVRAVSVDGPGQMSAFITGTFGTPEVVFNTATGVGKDSPGVELPVGAHTHLNWLFSETGIYTVILAATHPGSGRSATATVHFAVGVDPSTVPGGLTPVRGGHHDITLEMASSTAQLTGDALDNTPGDTAAVPLSDVVVVVPATALDIVPADPRYRVVGRPGHKAYLLRQAVIGKHVHGTIDPHVWQDPANVAALAQTIRDQLTHLDPAHGAAYSTGTAAYITDLEEADRYMRQAIDAIPPKNRYLVTTHDAYGYLGKAYGLTIAGFVSPNPSVEPTPRSLLALNDALDNLHIPAVFVEKNTSTLSKDLLGAAARRNIQVCPLWGDTFDDEVTTYLEMVHANADSLRRCLSDSS